MAANFNYNDSLWGAALNGNLDRLREIIEDPQWRQEEINQRNEYGYTALQVRHVMLSFYQVLSNSQTNLFILRHIVNFDMPETALLVVKAVLLKTLFVSC